ncbi:MAG: response regulator [Acidimicrobiales bacterium]
MIATEETLRHTPAVDVLVVDDDESIRTSFAEIISSNGYSTMEAEDGVVALELLSILDIGVVVLDVRMPRLDGLSLLEMIDDPPPVVLVTAASFEESGRGGVSKILWYLQKPVDPAHLLDAIASAIGTPDRHVPVTGSND